MLYPLERPNRRVRFGDSPKGAQLRRLCKELDRKKGQYRSAIKTVIECYDLWKKADQMGGDFTDDGWINDRWFRHYLQNMYDFCNGTCEEALDDIGAFEDA